MSADRLAELRRQRALAAEQLAWLDREIAAAEVAAGLAPSPRGAEGDSDYPAPALKLVARSRALPDEGSRAAVRDADRHKIEAEAENILASQRVAPAEVKKDVFRGCLLYLAFAFLLTALGSVALYYVFRLR